MICFLPMLTCHRQWSLVHGEADFLPLDSFRGAPYSVDETCIVKCMLKARHNSHVGYSDVHTAAPRNAFEMITPTAAAAILTPISSILLRH
jgi:hypothetical protein